MDLARKHKEKYGNKFTYTLIDERAYNRGLKRKGTYLLAGLLLVGALWVGIRSYNKKSITKLN
jgi:hypothetical protein